MTHKQIITLIYKDKMNVHLIISNYLDYGSILHIAFIAKSKYLLDRTSYKNKLMEGLAEQNEVTAVLYLLSNGYHYFKEGLTGATKGNHTKLAKHMMSLLELNDDIRCHYDIITKLVIQSIKNKNVELIELFWKYNKRGSDECFSWFCYPGIHSGMTGDMKFVKYMEKKVRNLHYGYLFYRDVPIGAIKSGNISMINYYLKKNYNIDDLVPEAIESGDYDIIEFFLKYFKRQKHMPHDYYAKTSLINAVKNQDMVLIDHIIGRNCSNEQLKNILHYEGSLNDAVLINTFFMTGNDELIERYVDTEIGDDILMISYCLKASIEAKNTKYIKKLIDENRELCYDKYDDDYLPSDFNNLYDALHSCVKHYNLEAFKYIYALLDKENEYWFFTINNIIRLAISNNHLELLEFILDKGVKMSWSDTLKCSRASNHLEMMKLVLRKGEEDGHQWTEEDRKYISIGELVLPKKIEETIPTKSIFDDIRDIKYDILEKIDDSLCDMKNKNIELIKDKEFYVF